MARSKEEVIKAYNELKFRLGTAPSSVQFFESAGVTSYELRKAFGSNAFSKLAVECGDKPNKFSTEKSDINEILKNYGELTRELEKIPVQADWLQKKLSPNINNIKAAHGLSFSDIRDQFYEYAVSDGSWSDIIGLFKNTPKATTVNHIVETQAIVTNAYKNDFIPPILNNLIHLSFFDENGTDFEKKINLLFQMLGFDVESKGQGTGRNPDGIALEPQNNYAIIIDSKARKDGYEIKQEDRKFIEYINTHRDRLKKIGATKLYLLIVSSKYDSASGLAINNILKETQVSTTMITAEQLLKILAYKIEKPRGFDPKKFENLLFEKGLILDLKIEKFIKKV